MYNFDNIDLNISERFKPFCMRIKKRVSERFLGNDRFYLLSIEFINHNYRKHTNHIGEAIPDGTFSLTEKYKRYLIRRRREINDAIFNSIITPGVVSVIT